MYLGGNGDHYSNYFLSINNSGTLSFSQDSIVWQKIQIPNIPFDAWTKFTITMSSEKTADLFVNGIYVTTLKSLYSVYNYGNMYFRTGALTSTTGDEFYLDDFSVTENTNQTLMTFENDVVGQAPSNMSVIYPSVLVSNSNSTSGSNSMQINDLTNVLTRINGVGTSSANKVLTFKIFPVTVPYGAMFMLTNQGVDVFKLKINSTGSLFWNNGAWVSIGGNVSMPKND